MKTSSTFHRKIYIDSSLGSSKFLILICIFIAGMFSPLLAQNSTLHQFVTETGRIYQNDLATDGIYLFGTKYDGGATGSGYIYKIRPDGTGFDILHNFNASEDGLNPVGALVYSDSVLYGMTIFGGAYDQGVIFSMRTDTAVYKKLLDFDGINGTMPYASLMVSGTVLYGLSINGGHQSNGIAFKINTDGSGFKDLLDFDGNNGWNPVGSLVLSGASLFGVTNRGGTHDQGVIFKVDTSGSLYENLHDFNGTDGAQPFGALTIKDSVLYGTTMQGGPNSGGVLFRIDTSGAYFQEFNIFSSAEGINPQGTLNLIDSTLYGMTTNGGWGGQGIIYKINLDGGGYKTLYHFDGITGVNPNCSLLRIDSTFFAYIPGGEFNYGTIFSIDTSGNGFQKLMDFTASNTGYDPKGSLLYTPDALYGMTQAGGIYNKGVIYKLNPDGGGYQVLLDFNGIDGANPLGSLILVDSMLYGMTEMGGNSQEGVMFRLNTDGSGFEKLMDFNQTDGAFPPGSLCQSGDLLYGVAAAGVTDNKGVVFDFNKETKVYHILFDFSGTDAYHPEGTLVMQDSLLYGMALGGLHDGVVFKINPDGTGFKKIIDSDGNNAGRYWGSLTIADSILYGVARQGGPTDNGVLFKANLDGTGLRTLFNFNYGYGIIPTGSLIVQDSLIFGMTEIGGPNNAGVTYKIDTSGNGYSIIIDFSGEGSIASGRKASIERTIHSIGSLVSSGTSILGVATLDNGVTRTAKIFRYELFPSEQASHILFSDIKNDNMNLSWHRGNGTNCAVFAKENVLDAIPLINGLIYSANSLFGSGTEIGQSGWYCIYNGSDTTCHVSGLKKNTTYQFVVCEYNNSLGSPRYLEAASTGNPASQTTTNLDYAPTVQASQLVFIEVESNQMTVTWTRGNGDHCLLFAQADSTGTVAPADGVNYTDSAIFGSGAGIGSWYCIYNGNGTSCHVTGLEENTYYRFMVLEYNDGNTGPLYLTGTAVGNPASRKTPPATVAPTVQASGIHFTSILTDRMTFTWTRGNGAECSVFARETNSTIVPPENGIVYADSSSFGKGSQIGESGWYSVYNGEGNTITVTGLNEATIYQFMVFEFNVGDGGPVYLDSTSTDNPKFQVTSVTIMAPSLQATHITFSETGSDQTMVSWTRGNGDHCALFAKEDTAGSVSPADNTEYSDSTVFGSGEQIGQTKWYCLYNGTGNEIHITALKSNTPYRFMVCEYNIGNEGPLYQTSTASGNPVTLTTTVTGLDRGTEEYAVIYPNPTEKYIIIKHDPHRSLYIQVYDRAGKKILTKPLEGDQLDVSRLSPGTYIIIINTQSYRFIKE